MVPSAGSAKARRRFAVANAACLAVLAPVLALAPATTAQAADGALGTFNGKASADGLHIKIAVTNFFIIENFLEGPGPTAQATVNSLGESIGFASYPNPGSTAQAIPGLLSTLTGQTLPSYPFTAYSEHPSTPEREIRQPGFTLSATSTETASSAFAGLGAISTESEIGTFSLADVGITDEGFVSVGESRSDFTFGPLKVTGVRSKASVTRTKAGKIVKEAELEISNLNLAGVPIAVTKDGLAVGNNQVPLPVLGTVSDTVTMGPSKLTFLEGSETANSVMSPAIEYTTTMPVPNLGAATAEVTFTLGRTFAQADAGALSSLGGGGSSPDLPVGPAAPDAGSGFEAAETPLTSEMAASPDVEPALPAGTPDLPAPPPALAAPGPSGGDTQQPVVQASLDTSSLTGLSFYPILLLAAGLILAASTGSQRFMKARVQWSS